MLAAARAEAAFAFSHVQTEVVRPLAVSTSGALAGRATVSPAAKF